MRGAAQVNLCVREHGGTFRRLILINLFCFRFFQLSRRALGHKGPPTQLHALPPFIEITPALMNSNLLPRVSAREPWQGIIHLVRSLARFYSFQATISLKCLISKFPGQFGRGSKISKIVIGCFAPGQNFQKFWSRILLFKIFKK